MNVSVTRKNLPQFIVQVSEYLVDHEKIEFSTSLNYTPFSQSKEYIQGQTEEYIPMSDFISELKDIAWS